MNDERDNEEILFDYILGHPDCSGGQIEKDTEISHATVYRFLRRRLKTGHILKNEEARRYRISPFKSRDPEKQKEIDMAWDAETKHRLDLNRLHKMEEFLRTAIDVNTEIKLNATTTDIRFSNETNNAFHLMIYSLLVEGFFGNPDLWHILKRPEDLRFSITIKANWNNDPRIFEVMQHYRDKCLSDHYLYPIPFSLFNRWPNLEEEEEDAKRKEVIGTKSPEDLYNKAFTETAKRLEWWQEYRKLAKALTPAYLGLIDEEIKNWAPSTKEFLALSNLRDEIERGYETFQDGRLVLIWAEDSDTGEKYPFITTEEWLALREDLKPMAKKLDDNLQSDKSVHPIIRQAMKGIFEETLPEFMHIAQKEIILAPDQVIGEQGRREKGRKKGKVPENGVRGRNNGISCDQCGERYSLSQAKNALESGKMKCACGNDLTRAARALLDEGKE